MKKILLSIALLVSCSAVYAIDVKESPISEAGTPYTVALTTYSWTKVSSLTGTKVNRRAGVVLCNLSTNNASMVGIWSASAPSVSTTTYSVEIETGEEKFISCYNGIDFYMLTKHTSTESVGGQEVKQ